MLLRQMKIILPCVLVLLLTGCSEYSKMLRNEEAIDRLEYAKKLFEQQEYNKAVKILEPYYQRFKNTKEGENADWIMAYSWYMDGSYELSSYLMSNFARSYPMSEKTQQAAFMAAQSSYNISPESYLDQENTTKAINALQRFIERYPNAPQVAQADSMIRELNQKLDKKAFDIAYNYYRMEDFNSAVIAFTNVLDDTPTTTQRENLMYYRTKAAAIYANRSIPDKQLERYADAITYGRLFLRQFPASQHAEEIGHLIKVMEENSAILDKVLKGAKDMDMATSKKLNSELKKEVKRAMKAREKEQKENKKNKQ